MNLLNYPLPGYISFGPANPFSRTGIHAVSAVPWNSAQLDLQRATAIHWKPRTWTATGVVTDSASIALSDLQKGSGFLLTTLDPDPTVGYGIIIGSYPICDASDALTAGYWSQITGQFNVPVTYSGYPGAFIYTTYRSAGTPYAEAPATITVSCAGFTFDLQLYYQTNIAQPDSYPSAQATITATELFF